MTHPSRIPGLLALPSLCLGLCLVAVCLLVPQAEANRRVAVDRDQLRQDVAHADAQLAVDERFLAAATDDPEVAERLAQRQARLIRGGTAALHLGDDAGRLRPVATITDMLRVPTPPPVPAYRPLGGQLAALTRDARRQLYGLGVGLFLIAAGLMMGPGDDAGVAADPEFRTEPPAMMP